MDSHARRIRSRPTPLNQAIRCRIMKAVSLRLALQLGILAFVLAAAGRADAKDAAAVSNGDVRAKIRYCQDCHGPSGQGFRGFFPIPRLAGQQPEYLKNQLQAFVERRRTNNIMFNVAHVLKPAMITAIAASFKNLNPKPLGGAPKKQLQAKTFSKTAFLTPTLPRVRPATVPRPPAMEKFLVWQVNSIHTSLWN
jgi:cytochrome c553